MRTPIIVALAAAGLVLSGAALAGSNPPDFYDVQRWPALQPAQQQEEAPAVRSRSAPRDAAPSHRHAPRPRGGKVPHAQD
ncbi:hypothetical protein [Labrys wisconsinensis]|uniref:Uncharacterized protein n=1 Tax=Labrys wisconsinensis TaxID=425677 RepID=A0ABU0JLI3_9HYPH|nr:hypothetical protein [Labrys wisconsinensis]MDQ0475149.1 hypothetical protein [Labrys wisconsinensis]